MFIILTGGLNMFQIDGKDCDDPELIKLHIKELKGELRLAKAELTRLTEESHRPKPARYLRGSTWRGSGLDGEFADRC